MFFSKAIRSFFATHPPLTDRIYRLQPDFDGRFIPQEVSEEKPTPIVPEPAKPAVAAATSSVAEFAVDADAVIRQPGNVSDQNINQGRQLLAAIPQAIKNELSDILGAMSVTCMLLLDEDPQVRNIQIKRLQKSAPGRLVEHLVNLEPHLKALDVQLRLPVLDLALPVLRQMSAGQYAKFKVFIQILVEADARLSFYEFALQQIIKHRLGANYQRHKKEVVFKNIASLALDAVNIISQLAHFGHPHEVAAQVAFTCGWEKLRIQDSRWKMLPAGKVSFGALGVALQRFSLAAPGVKKHFLDACAHCVLHDKQITLKEAELLRAIAYALNIPLPPFLEASDGLAA